MHKINNTMEFRNYLSGESVIKFYACGLQPFNKLSNFTLIKDGITFDELTYCSTEHAFQAQKYIQEQRIRFSIQGDLGNEETGFELVFGDNWKKKHQYWMKKKNIGIIAKMATNKKIGKKLGLIRDANFSSTNELWLSILTQKFNIHEFKMVLQATANNYLLEFDRGAKRSSPKWAGIINDGTLYGNNLMGKYLMAIRDTLC